MCSRRGVGAGRLTDWWWLEGGVGLQAGSGSGVWFQAHGGLGLRGLWVVDPTTELALRLGFEGGGSSLVGSIGDQVGSVLLAVDARHQLLALELGAGVGLHGEPGLRGDGHVLLLAAPRFALPLGFIGVRTQVLIGGGVQVDARLTWSLPL
ncbi:MAG: hypothetical protein Q8O67_31375 [Deltaproteobacteria bacterium]|nr:hypothetical protein [Deltaproteobacteria bacterium]